MRPGRLGWLRHSLTIREMRAAGSSTHISDPAQTRYSCSNRGSVSGILCTMRSSGYANRQNLRKNQVRSLKNPEFGSLTKCESSVVVHFSGIFLCTRSGGVHMVFARANNDSVPGINLIAEAFDALSCVRPLHVLGKCMETSYATLLEQINAGRSLLLTLTLISSNQSG